MEGRSGVSDCLVLLTAEASRDAAIMDDRTNKQSGLTRNPSTTSELQSRFPRGTRQRGDAAVITEPRTVERDRLDARGARLFGDRLAHGRRGGLVLGALQVATQRLLDGGSGRDNGFAVGGNHLRIDVLAAAVDAQARHRQLADACARGFGAAQTRGFLVDHGLSLLRFFQRDALAGVTNALALVRLRRTRSE